MTGAWNQIIEANYQHICNDSLPRIPLRVRIKNLWILKMIISSLTRIWTLLPTLRSSRNNLKLRFALLRIQRNQQRMLEYNRSGFSRTRASIINSVALSSWTVDCHSTRSQRKSFSPAHSKSLGEDPWNYLNNFTSRWQHPDLIVPFPSFEIRILCSAAQLEEVCRSESSCMYVPCDLRTWVPHWAALSLSPRPYCRKPTASLDWLAAAFLSRWRSGHRKIINWPASRCLAGRHINNVAEMSSFLSSRTCETRDLVQASHSFLTCAWAGKISHQKSYWCIAFDRCVSISPPKLSIWAQAGGYKTKTLK